MAKKKRDQLKLHEAIIEVLNDFPNNSATPKEISSEIASRNLYRKYSDNRHPASGQISARVNKYLHLFRKLSDGRIQNR